MLWRLVYHKKKKVGAYPLPVYQAHRECWVSPYHGRFVIVFATSIAAASLNARRSMSVTLPVWSTATITTSSSEPSGTICDQTFPCVSSST